MRTSPWKPPMISPLDDNPNSPHSGQPYGNYSTCIFIATIFAPTRQGPAPDAPKRFLEEKWTIYLFEMRKYENWICGLTARHDRRKYTTHSFAEQFGGFIEHYKGCIIGRIPTCILYTTEL